MHANKTVGVLRWSHCIFSAQDSGVAWMEYVILKCKSVTDYLLPAYHIRDRSSV